MIISNISLDCCSKLKTLVVLSNGKVKWFKLKVMDIHHVCHIHSYKHHYDIASKVMTKLTEWLLTYEEMSAIFCFCLGSANLFEIMISTQIRYKWEYIGVLFLPMNAPFVPQWRQKSDQELSGAFIEQSGTPMCFTIGCYYGWISWWRFPMRELASIWAAC